MKLCGTKHCQGWLKIVIITIRVSNNKPLLNLTTLFMKNGDNLATLWETVDVSNENVQEPTNMFAESTHLC